MTDAVDTLTSLVTLLLLKPSAVLNTLLSNAAKVYLTDVKIESCFFVAGPSTISPALSLGERRA